MPFRWGSWKAKPSHGCANVLAHGCTVNGKLRRTRTARRSRESLFSPRTSLWRSRLPTAILATDGPLIILPGERGSPGVVVAVGRQRLPRATARSGAAGREADASVSVLARARRRSDGQPGRQLARTAIDRRGFSSAFRGEVEVKQVDLVAMPAGAGVEAPHVTAGLSSAGLAASSASTWTISSAGKLESSRFACEPQQVFFRQLPGADQAGDVLRHVALGVRRCPRWTRVLIQATACTTSSAGSSPRACELP